MSPREKALLERYRALSPEDQRTLEAFAEFLAARAPQAPRPAVTEPLPIPRPEKETVVRAIQRLRATYPMLDPRVLFQETSICLSRHVLHGQPAEAVIDELEEVFSRHYRRLKAGG